MGSAQGAGAATVLNRHDFMLVKALQGAQHNFVITNPNMPDNPIVYASSGFYQLTGFPPEEVMGRNCRFLQGPGTDQRAVQRIRDSITRGQDCQVCLVNYKRDGTLFYNQFFIAPLRGKDSHIVENFIGVQCPVSKEQFDIFQKSQFEHDQKAEAERKKSGTGLGGVGNPLS